MPVMTPYRKPELPLQKAHADRYWASNGPLPTPKEVATAAPKKEDEPAQKRDWKVGERAYQLLVIFAPNLAVVTLAFLFQWIMSCNDTVIKQAAPESQTPVSRCSK